MKKLISLLSILALFSFYRCSDDFTDENPDLPSSIDIDIDNNGNIDYQIRYMQVHVFAKDYDQMIMGRLYSLADNEILQNSEDEALFLRDINQIKENVTEPYHWSNPNNGRALVYLTNNFEGEWATTWRVFSSEEYSTYFLGLKFIGNNVTELGWVELEVNIDNGEIKIVNKGVL